MSAYNTTAIDAWNACEAFDAAAMQNAAASVRAAMGDCPRQTRPAVIRAVAGMETAADCYSMPRGPWKWRAQADARRKIQAAQSTLAASIETVEAFIPFAGFYGSLHSDAIDQVAEMAFQDSSGDMNESLYDSAVTDIAWGRARLEYAKEYARCYAVQLGIAASTFSDMISPREYNFGTDRIFIRLPVSEFRRILDATPRGYLAQIAKEWFTSRDGFMSHYDSDPEAWGEPEEFDHNQIGAVLVAYWRAREVADDMEPQEDWESEFSLDMTSEGMNLLDAALYGGEIAPAVQRALNIADYLRERAERRWRAAA